MSEQYDILIIGAGMVGLCLANLLSELPLSIAIVEAHTVPEWDKDTYNERVSAVSLASQKTLLKAGAWAAITESRVSYYSDMHIWEKGLHSSESLHFSNSDVAVDNLGCIVENNLIRATLKSCLESRNKPKANITWYCPDKLASINITESWAFVELTSGKKIQSKLIIATDGANSMTRRSLQLPEVSRSYDQYGVVTQLEVEKSHQQAAYQRFYNQEVLGILPLQNSKQCSIVWSCSQNKTQSLLSLTNEELAQEINEFSQNVLGKISVTMKAKAFPLQLLHSRQYVSQRVVLCGDAAHSVHPLAGQGLNLGLLDAAVLSNVLNNAWKKNYDLGDLSLLRQYERQRKANNVQMMTVLDSLLSIFKTNNPALKQIRRTGMSLVNKIQPFKKNLIKEALGIDSI